MRSFVSTISISNNNKVISKHLIQFPSHVSYYFFFFNLHWNIWIFEEEKKNKISVAFFPPDVSFSFFFFPQFSQYSLMHIMRKEMRMTEYIQRETTTREWIQFIIYDVLLNKCHRVLLNSQLFILRTRYLQHFNFNRIDIYRIHFKIVYS